MPAKPRYKVDAKVRALVDALNSLPGIFTFASCGGHAKRTNETQLPADEFVVNFGADVLAGGWLSLEWIARTIDFSEDVAKLTVTVWSEDKPDTMAFELKGIDHAVADDLAELLRPASVETRSKPRRRKGKT